MRRLLTDRFCMTVKTTEVQADFFDAQCSGLALRVSHTGRKSWTLHYSHAGGRKRLTLGRYPALSLADARTRADEIKSGAPVGDDTLQGVCENYMVREGSRLRSAGLRKATLERCVYPTFGLRPIGGIRRSEIVALLDRIETSGGPAMADKILAILRKVMNWHATRTDDFHSPIVRGMARSPKIARERILTDQELRTIWRASEGVFGALIKFLLLTGARRNEAQIMAREEIVGSDWILPAARNKTKMDLVRPLSAAARKVLPQHNRRFVFSLSDRPIGSIGKLKAHLDRVSGVSGWVIHDLRRTARSLMSRAGVPTDHAERCLGHVIGGVRGVYDRHEYHAEKAKAFEALAAVVGRIVR